MRTHACDDLTRVWEADVKTGKFRKGKGEVNRHQGQKYGRKVVPYTFNPDVKCYMGICHRTLNYDSIPEEYQLVDALIWAC